MIIPVATYRVQLNGQFRFEDARGMLPYLQGLGFSHLYISPIFKARHGSMHGYDVTDYSQLNPELGAAEDFEALVQDLRERGMSLLLDIVPNHMAATPENPWWMDVLENGPASPFAGFFDINWEPLPKGGQENVLLPVLGGPYGSVLEGQELILGIDGKGFFIRYYEMKFPVDPKTYRDILRLRLDHWRPSRAGTSAARGFEELLEAIEQLPDRSTVDDEVLQVRRRDQDPIKKALWRLYSSEPEIRQYIDETVRIFNGVKGEPASFDHLDSLLDKQPYSLAYWRVAREKINYRRFFDISDLIGVRVDKPAVFDASHELVLRLIREGKVSGLRIDHIDGLFDPARYLEKLREQTRLAAGPPPGKSFYVVVEKILTGDESLPPEWPVCGTTGYDFIGAVGGLFTDPEGLRILTKFYSRHTGYTGTFVDVIYQRKKRVLRELFAGEIHSLGLHLALLAEYDRHSRDLSPAELNSALAEVTACLPVYRTYTRSFEVSLQDRIFIDRAVADAAARNPAVGSPVFDFLRRVLVLDFPPSLPETQRHEWLRFVMRWQQLTGPVVAKGMEDTALYVYNRLVSLNEVGGRQEAMSPAEFHRFNLERRENWSCSMNASSTHDTKRSEDVRARISILSEMAPEWVRAVSRWRRWNKSRKQRIERQMRPDANEELQIYQTLIGAWPLNEEEVPAFRERMKQYVRKAAREAKVHTSWLHPSEEHEEALLAFIDAILEPSGENRFLEDFIRFQGRIAYYGAISSLAQTLLKITSPGIPDFYQGCVLWDFSLVDPDNRRPVDFPRRQGILDELRNWEADQMLPHVGHLLENWQDSGIKVYLTFRALRFRRNHRELFDKGDYLPLQAAGNRENQVLAFARRCEGSWAVVVVPRLFTRLSPSGRPPLGRRIWYDTHLIIPEDAPDSLVDVFTGRKLEVQRRGGVKALNIADILRDFPVAMLTN